MKKTYTLLFVLVSILCGYVSSFFQLNIYASAQKPQFARIVNKLTYFYSRREKSEDSRMFLLPETYFVQLLAPSVNNFYLARYIDIQGYVYSTDIKFTSQIPLNPYDSARTFRVFAQNGLNMRSSAKESEGINNKICTLPYLENNVQLYGSLLGEEAVPFRGKEWLYCRYSSSGSNNVFGYVYAGYCDLITPSILNSEIVEYVDFPTFKDADKTDSPSSGQVFSNLSFKQQILIIIALSIPAMIIIWLLFKPNQLATQTNSKKVRPRKQIDYIELD